MCGNQIHSRRALLSAAGAATTALISSGTALAHHREDHDQGGGERNSLVPIEIAFGGCSQVTVTGDLSNVWDLNVIVETGSNGVSDRQTISYTDVESPVFTNDMANEIDGDPDYILAERVIVRGRLFYLEEINPHGDRCSP